jgi:hypothetical protein
LKPDLSLILWWCGTFCLVIACAVLAGAVFGLVARAVFGPGQI